MSRKTSQKVPPTSYDSYAAQQSRLAANRVSRAPKIYSTASVAKEMREIMNEQQVEMAETFYFS